jgi:hypothetical protein
VELASLCKSLPCYEILPKDLDVDGFFHCITYEEKKKEIFKLECQESL